MLKKTILCFLLIGITTNNFYSQTKGMDYTKAITSIINDIDKLKAENTQLIKQNQDLQDQYASLKTTLDQYSSLNSGVSNYLTVLSIVLTLLAIALPFINLFTVILEGYNKSSVPKHPKINITRYQDEKVRQRI